MELIVSIIALVISFVTLVRTSETNKKLTQFQEESAKLAALQRTVLEKKIEEGEKCTVCAYWYLDSNGEKRIAVHNIGYVNAYNINFEFKPKLGNEAPLVKGEMERVFPIKKLSPTSESNFFIAPCTATGSEWPAHISWHDESGKYYVKSLIIGE